MNELKASPGPWELIEVPRGFIVTADERSYDVAIVWNLGYHDNKANAALIAAAPEIYAALDEAETRIIELCGAYSHPLPLATMTRIRDVLKKARGE